ncbi:uncharacterized protein LOC106640915 [Copidosoma floridanum]|uniref:uncharacterized protein LOC106640915 n=1 Tax=Copidosoma floridanum TaxID=29053 RepID=UPI0006C9620F|nr:uncharacterized protein LOC106640915 [Copidosoma floridanum]
MRAIFFAFLLVVLVAYASAACEPKMCESICKCMGYSRGECLNDVCYCKNAMGNQNLVINTDELAAIFNK